MPGTAHVQDRTLNGKTDDPGLIGDTLANHLIVITTTSVWAMAPVSLYLVSNQPIMLLFAKKTLDKSNISNQLAIVEYHSARARVVMNSISSDHGHALVMKLTMTKNTA